MSNGRTVSIDLMGFLSRMGEDEGEGDFSMPKATMGKSTGGIRDER